MSLTKLPDLSNRRILAKTISMVESNTEQDCKTGDAIITEIYNKLETPHSNPTKIIAITGTPGSGKSTFIDNFGLKLANAGHKLAVIAIDPSSSLSGGAILGDKTRMINLANHPNVFIRPSSSTGSLGGISPKTEDVIYILKAAKFDYILIETIGVGQNESDVALLADIVLMLLPPATGDELQGIKKGNLEFSDFLLINKFDGASKDLAIATADEYQSALKGTGKKVFLISAIEHTGFDKVLAEIEKTAQKKTLMDKEHLLTRRIESGLFKTLITLPEIAEIFSHANQQQLPTRIKSKIFIEELKKLLTSQQGL